MTVFHGLIQLARNEGYSPLKLDVLSFHRVCFFVALLVDYIWLWCGRFVALIKQELLRHGFYFGRGFDKALVFFKIFFYWSFFLSFLSICPGYVYCRCVPIGVLGPIGRVQVQSWELHGYVIPFLLDFWKHREKQITCLAFCLSLVNNKSVKRISILGIIVLFRRTMICYELLHGSGLGGHSYSHRQY